MASYKKEKYDAVIDIINKFTGETLDNYTRDTVIKVGKSKMDKGASAIEVADAIYDCLKESYSGGPLMAAMCQQICPKSILLILRNEIITAIK